MFAESAVDASKTTAHMRAIARVAVVAVFWGAFLCWCLLVMRGDALIEAAKAAIWLGRVIAVYLGMLSYWILYNKMLHALHALPVLAKGEERTFNKDYFGRPVAVEARAAFQDQHLVLVYAEEQKRYCVPAAEGVVEDDSVVAADLKKLAAAAGAGYPAVTPVPPPSAPKPASEEQAKTKTRAKGKPKAKRKRKSKTKTRSKATTEADKNGRDL